MMGRRAAASGSAQPVASPACEMLNVSYRHVLQTALRCCTVRASSFSCWHTAAATCGKQPNCSKCVVMGGPALIGCNPALHPLPAAAGHEHNTAALFTSLKCRLMPTCVSCRPATLAAPAQMPWLLPRPGARWRSEASLEACCQVGWWGGCSIAWPQQFLGVCAGCLACWTGEGCGLQGAGNGARSKYQKHM